MALDDLGALLELVGRGFDAGRIARGRRGLAFFEDFFWRIEGVDCCQIVGLEDDVEFPVAIESAQIIFLENMLGPLIVRVRSLS